MVDVYEAEIGREKMEIADSLPGEGISEGSKDMIHGHCYCGEFSFQIPRNIQPYRSAYCHCDSCRRAHSAPLYQVIYIPQEEFVILNGSEYVQEYRKSDSKVTRAFCKQCGSKLFNRLHGPNRVGWLGVFPNLFDEKEKTLPENLRPTHHLHTSETVLELEKYHDELERLME